MKELKLSLPIPPSLNSAFRNIRINCRVPTQEAKNWTFLAKRELQKAVRDQKWEMSSTKTVVEITVFWKDARRQDVSNREKLLGDAMNEIVFIDDCFCLPRFMDYSIDRENPRVELKIYLLDNENQQ